jgi:hypothetical protein
MTDRIEDRQAFERHPELAEHIERMATLGHTSTLRQWNEFLGSLNDAISHHTTPQEIVPDALVNAAELVVALADDDDYSAKELESALTLPRTTIEEAEARGAAKERERLATSISNQTGRDTQ